MDAAAPTSAVSVRAALDSLTDHWSPRVIAQVNDQYVKVAKLLGEFVWHAHPDEDELFQVVYGTLVIQFEDRDNVTLEPGDLYVVPKGVRHNPVAAEEVGIVLIETVTTAHTGDVVSERSKSIDAQLAG
jgi:mannose-6-phosphate isomerase-like protein (cupin superfamily)